MVLNEARRSHTCPRYRPLAASLAILARLKDYPRLLAEKHCPKPQISTRKNDAAVVRSHQVAPGTRAHVVRHAEAVHLRRNAWNYQH